MPLRRRFSASLWLSDFWLAVSRAFGGGLVRTGSDAELIPLAVRDLFLFDRLCCWAKSRDDGDVEDVDEVIACG